MSSNSFPLLTENQSLIADARVFEIIADSHVQGPTACFVTNAGTVIAVNQLALEVLGKERNDVVGHLVTELDGSSVTVEMGALPTLETRPHLVDSVELQDGGLIKKIVPVQGTPLQVYWLRGLSPALSRSSGDLDQSRVLSASFQHSPLSFRDSPNIKRLASVQNHLSGNALNQILAGQSPAVEQATLQAYEACEQIRKHVGFAETLELNNAQIRSLGTGFITVEEYVSNFRNVLKTVFLQEDLVSHIGKVVFTSPFQDALDKNYSLDWKRVSFVISHLLQNAFEHGGDEVQIILEVDYDPLEGMLKIFIQDNGPGMNPVYLSEAIDGITFTEDAKVPTSKPGIIFRVCRLLVEDVLQGRFIAKTNSAGTAFELSIKVKSNQLQKDSGISSFRSVAIETGDVELEAIVGSCSTSVDPYVIHGEQGAFRRVPSLLRVDDFISFDPPQQLIHRHERKKGYFELPGLQSNLVPLETILRLENEEEDANVVTDLKALLSDSVRFPLDAPILHVDDEKSGLMQIGRFIKLCNLTSYEGADCGESALHKVKEAIKSGAPYQMIFMDQILGGNSKGLDKGHLVAEKVLELYQEAGLSPPVIIPASGNMTEEDLAIYRASGMSCELYLKKPFDIQQMKKIVERYFIGC